MLLNNIIELNRAPNPVKRCEGRLVGTARPTRLVTCLAAHRKLGPVVHAAHVNARDRALQGVDRKAAVTDVLPPLRRTEEPMRRLDPKGLRRGRGLLDLGDEFFVGLESVDRQHGADAECLTKIR